MKLIALVLFVCFNVTSKAANYYLSTQSGDDSLTSLQAQNPVTPWKTLNKLNTFMSLQPGDSVLFKRSEIFYGSLGSNASGALGNVIFYGSYGAGANPIISGFTALSGWTLLNGSIYYTSLDVATLNMVTVDDIVKGMGRYPNTGYLNYESHVNNTSITDNQLIATPNWTGAEVVIRKYRWILDRHPVSSHSGNKLTYTAIAPYGNNNAYQPVNGNGYFMQGHLSTLDQLGEWYYDNAANRLYMHFGSGSPTGKVIKASTIDRNSTINTSSNITFSNIAFEGGNTCGTYHVGCSNITYNNCSWINQGGNSVYGIDVENIVINGGSITNSLNNAIYIEYNGNNTTVNDVSIINSGIIAGAGMSGDGVQEGININGNGTAITNCSVKNSGYNGIGFSGNNILVENNFVDSFCKIKDDGGGIYTYLNNDVTALNRIIRNNIITNAIGAYAGVETYSYESHGKAAGIYLDGYSNHTKVEKNTLAHGEWAGIFINNNSDNQITDNLVYDFSQQLLLIESSVGTIRNTTITGNEFIAKKTFQKTSHVHMYVNDNPAHFGTFNNNYYARPIDDTTTITVHRDYAGGGGATDITLDTWKSNYNQDPNSSISSRTIADTESLRFEYNASKSPKTVWLNQNYISVSGNHYSGVLTILPYSSIVLIKDSNTQILPLQFLNFTGKWFGKNIVVQWNTLDEKNTKSFEVEKSSNSIDFRKMGSLASKNRNSLYTLTDSNPLLGTNYYRIKQVDKDGKYTYSKTIRVVASKSFSIRVSPNPSMNNLHIKFDVPKSSKKIYLSIKNSQGTEIKNFFYDSSVENVKIDISSLQRGIYYLALNADNFVVNEKFVKQ